MQIKSNLQTNCSGLEGRGGRHSRPAQENGQKVSLSTRNGITAAATAAVTWFQQEEKPQASPPAPAAGAQLTAGTVPKRAGRFAVSQQHPALPPPFCARRTPGYYPDFPAGPGRIQPPPSSSSSHPLATAESQPGPPTSRPPAVQQDFSARTICSLIPAADRIV